MAEQTCKECEGQGDIYPDVDAWSARYISPEFCPICEGTGTVHRTGPYQLADGSWSDGVDRTKPINFRQITGRFEVAVWVSPLLGVATKFVVWHKSTGLTPREFPTFEAAIAYADRAARGRA